MIGGKKGREYAFHVQVVHVGERSYHGGSTRQSNALCLHWLWRSPVAGLVCVLLSVL